MSRGDGPARPAPPGPPGLHAAAAGWPQSGLTMGRLEPLLRREGVTDVLVNGDGSVWFELAGRLERAGFTLSDRDTRVLIERAATAAGRRVDQSSPMVDARLPDGSRVHAITPPLAVDGPCLSVRRFGRIPFDLADLAPGHHEMLAAAVRERRNILIAGATGTGKTTLLNTLVNRADPAERLVTIEDAAELQIGHANLVRLETRPASPDGPAPVTIRDLVRAALRMRPDRLIVGEVRGAEAFDMLGALNTGHAGSMTTVHANSPAAALRKLEVLALTAAENLPLWAVREQVAEAFDLVVHVERTDAGARQVTRVEPVGPAPGPGQAVRP